MIHLPPMPWARWEDGEPLGWDTSWRIWKAFLFPYRTYSWEGYDEAKGEFILGPAVWHRPDILNRKGRHAEAL